MKTTIQSKQQSIVAIDDKYHKALVLAHAEEKARAGRDGRSMKGIVQDSLLKDPVFIKQFKKLGGRV
tara:strand:+ start:757 stop:957 length:201 start_codon:yes stop_codon:yes gene_type:complete